MPRPINPKYGCKKSAVEDTPTRLYAVSKIQKGIPSVDLRHLCPPVYDQGQTNSCTANAIAAAYQIDEIKEKESSPFTPSRLFIYYNERVIEGDPTKDEGAFIQHGIQSINTVGVCPEVLVPGTTKDECWPFVENQVLTKPHPGCFTFAETHKSISYHRVAQTIGQLKQTLINGFPVVFGFQVYPEFESDACAETGLLKMPGPGEKCVGCHAVLMVGYDDNKKVGQHTGAFTVRNSWGEDWGDKGYFYMAYEYVTDPNLANDFWVVMSVKDS
jgi:C1A family cysteine protease